MSGFPAALDAAMHGRYGLSVAASEPKRPVTHRQGLTARMNRIAKAVGGNRRDAAREAGIPYSTWGHLLSGKRSANAVNSRKVELAFSRLVTAPAIAAKVKKEKYPVHYIVGAVTVGDPKGKRYINGKKDGPSNAQGWREVKWKLNRRNSKDVVMAWFGHGGDAAAQKFVDCIRREYGTEFGFEGDDVEVTLNGKQ